MTPASDSIKLPLEVLPPVDVLEPLPGMKDDRGSTIDPVQVPRDTLLRVQAVLSELIEARAEAGQSNVVAFNHFRCQCRCYCCSVICTTQGEQYIHTYDH